MIRALLLAVLCSGVTSSYRACPSCAGKGVLAPSHSCAMCGSQLQLSNQVSAMQISTPASVKVANSAPVVIPVASERRGAAFLTQQTSDGGYVTQSVNVVQSVETHPATTTVVR